MLHKTLLFNVCLFMSALGIWGLILPWGTVFAQDTGEPMTIAGEPQIQFCPEFFVFGNIGLDITPSSNSVLPEGVIQFDLSIANRNPEPIINGRVYMKIFKIEGSDFDTTVRNGYPIVDLVLAADGISIPANGVTTINVPWQAPLGIDGGDYTANFYINEDGTNELLGVISTDHIFAGDVPFRVVSEDKETDLYFDKGTVSLNENAVDLAGPVYRFEENEHITVRATIVNPSNETKVGELWWWVTNWDEVITNEGRAYHLTSVELGPNERKAVSLIVPANVGPDILVQGILNQDGAKSVLHVRMVRGENEAGDIVYSGLTPIVTGAGENATAYACVRDLMKDIAGELVLEMKLLDGNGTELHSVSENLLNRTLPALVKTDIVLSNDEVELILHTQLRENGNVIGEIWKSYDCNRLGTICSDRGQTTKEQNLALAVIFILVALMVLLAILVYRHKGKGSLENMHYPKN